tara:strand:+ start:1882 stop:2574 length:693 start_codon:yes stop_codon:yes gene_type:complete
MMRTRKLAHYIGLLLLLHSYPATGATPGEVYQKHRSKIVQEKFSVFDGNLFITIHSKVNKKLDSAFLYRKMKVKALKQVLPRFSQYRHSGVKKEWFDLYFSLPSFAKFSIKNSFVVDKKITLDQAYLVLTVPEKEVTPAVPDPKTTRDSINRAFDEGVPMNFLKYSRLAEGERLRMVKERLAAGFARSSEKETSVDDELPDQAEIISTKPDAAKKIPGVVIKESDMDDLL